MKIESLFLKTKHLRAVILIVALLAQSGCFYATRAVNDLGCRSEMAVPANLYRNQSGNYLSLSIFDKDHNDRHVGYRLVELVKEGDRYKLIYSANSAYRFSRMIKDEEWQDFLQKEHFYEDLSGIFSVKNNGELAQATLGNLKISPHENNTIALWAVPLKVLYIPALAFDVVTFPIQFFIGMNEFKNVQ